MNRLWAAWVVALLPALAWGDVVTLRDGRVREGIVTGKDERELRLTVEREGIRGTLVIPMDEVVSVEEKPLSKPAATATAPASPTVPPAATEPTTLPARQPEVPAPPPAEADAVTPAQARPAASQFLQELLRTALGNGIDDPQRLAPDRRQLVQNVLDADQAGKPDRLLPAMEALATAMRDEPIRLDAIFRRIKGKDFSLWMAQTRWGLIKDKYKTGQFDLQGVTEIERPALIGLLRSATPAALQPLEAYFPKPPAVGVRPARPPENPILGITPANALSVKDRASYAAAVLGAQLKLEPEMPREDKNLLYQQLGYVRRCLVRAAAYEPAAKALVERQEREKKLADERARREAAMQQNRLGPRH